MKKLFRYIAVCFLGLAFTNCSDEDLVQGANRIYNDGDEIEFSVSASVPSGNSHAENSRTIYGDHTADVNGVGKIDIKWVTDDAIDIACPEASGVQQVSYKVPSTSHGENVATSLIRTSGDIGLRWNGEGDHQFYSIYPSSSVFDVNKKYPATMKDRPFFRLQVDAQGNKKAVGHLPKNFVAVHRTQTQKKGVKYYQVTPNMDYAFMVAQTTSNLALVNAQGLSLSYQSLATALEFDLTADVVKNPNSSTPDSKVFIQLDRIELESMDKTNLWGDFEYDFSHSTLTNTSTGVNNHLNYYLSYDGMKDNAIILKNKDVCTVHLFLMPDKNLQDQKLKIRIWYTVNGQYKRQSTATLGKEIKCRYKYAFKKVTMPKVNVDVKGSTWFAAVDDAVYINQLSFLCAGNAFSNVDGIKWYDRQQVMNYNKLWDRGVRGFEFVNQSITPNGGKGIGDQRFVCGEEIINNSPTFHEAFSNLAKYLVDTDNYPDFNHETLILFARYHAVNDGYHPENYIKNVLDYLEYTINHGIDYTTPDGVQIKGKKLTKDHFVLLNPTSTASDLRGKIAVIFRVADDAYLQFNQNNPAKVSSDLKIESSTKSVTDWANRVVRIDNWGHAVDRWDRRYQNVARNATWVRGYNDQNLRFVEDYLWAASREETRVSPLYDQFGSSATYLAYSGFQPMPENLMTPLTDPVQKYQHTTSVSNALAMIQEWARVIPDDLNNIPVVGDIADARNYSYTNLEDLKKPFEGLAYPWYRWPSSIDEKKKEIKELFKSVIRTTGGENTPLHINVISGYYADAKHKNSVEPFDEYLCKWNLHDNHPEVPGATKNKVPDFKPSGQGNGGNFAALAATLNPYVYHLLTEKISKQGPWGLVVCDYLGAEANQFTAGANNDLHGANAEEAARLTKNLLELFISNNFSFELKKDPTVRAKAVREARTMNQQEEELIFE